MAEPRLEAVPDGLQAAIITDCYDANARARQQLRFGSLFGVTPAFIELGGHNADLEAAGQLVDAFDALTSPILSEQTPSVVLVNVAPRGDDVREKWENGTPFCHFKVGETTVVSTYEGRALSLAHRLGLVTSVDLLDIPESTNALADEGILTHKQAESIQNTQFRSLEFLQIAARLLVTGQSLPSAELELIPHQGAENRAWFVDNFGNVKTTLLADDVDFEEGQTVTVMGEKIQCYDRLTDVPTAEFGATIGSSGYGNNRWIEIVLQKGHAAQELDLQVGSMVVEKAG